METIPLSSIIKQHFPNNPEDRQRAIELIFNDLNPRKAGPRSKAAYIADDGKFYYEFQQALGTSSFAKASDRDQAILSVLMIANFLVVSEARQIDVEDRSVPTASQPLLIKLGARRLMHPGQP